MVVGPDELEILAQISNFLHRYNENLEKIEVDEETIKDLYEQDLQQIHEEFELKIQQAM